MTFANQKGLNVFAQVMHEVIESINIFSNSCSQDREFPCSEFESYASAHWNALASQAKLLGVDFIYSTQGSSSFVFDSEYNDFYAITYKKITEGKNKGMYVETTYHVRISKMNGTVSNAEDPTSEIVSGATYHQAVNRAKKELRDAKRRKK
jgi:hypothetical protein